MVWSSFFDILSELKKDLLLISQKKNIENQEERALFQVNVSILSWN